MKTYYAYILTNHSRTVLYIGVTNDLTRRLQEHIGDSLEGKKTFAGKYNCTHLLYYEEFRQVNDAIAREKERKGWKRERKIELVRTSNPDLKSLILW